MGESSAIEKTVRLNLIFERDALTSHQYFKVFQQKPGSDPERRLMFAVLSDAIECFQKYSRCENRRGRKLFVNAERWINSRDASWPYSFEFICDVLGINADYLRLGLVQWRSEHESDSGGRRRIREPLRFQYRVKHNRLRI